MKRKGICLVPHMLMVLFFLVACSSPVRMQESLSEPPEHPYVGDFPSTLSSPPISTVGFGTLVVDLERTTLNHISSEAGVGAIQHRGDAGDSEYWLCFTVTNPLGDHAQRVWITSSEIGGPEHSVNGLIVSELNTHQSESLECPELPERLRPVSLTNQLWVGLSSEQLKRVLGEPSAVKGNWLLYSYSGKVVSNGFDRFALFGARIADGKVVTIFTSQSTTN